MKRRPLVETVVVICEGSSENSYLQELNRFFRRHSIPLSFVSKIIGSGVYKAAVNRYRDVRRDMKNAEILIWVDSDLYMHSQKELYQNKPASIPDFLFSHMNFEDFLAMHLDRKSLMQWQAVCEKHGHFEVPLTSALYLPLYRANCFPHYRKGRLPFKMTEDALERLFSNMKREYVAFRCGFAEFLEERLQIVRAQLA